MQAAIHLQTAEALHRPTLQPVLGNAGDCHTQATPGHKHKLVLSQRAAFLSPPPLPYRYFRATRTPKVESLVCAISTTKAAVQFDPADYPGFCTAHGWEGDQLLENNLPVSVSVILRKGSSACSVFPPYPAAQSAAFVHVGALPHHPWRLSGFFQP